MRNECCISDEVQYFFYYLERAGLRICAKSCNFAQPF